MHFITIISSYIIYTFSLSQLAFECLLSLESTNGSEGLLHEKFPELRLRRFESNEKRMGSVECAICLCKIEDGEEIREMACDHIFHRVCLDKWLGCSKITCPLCRKYVKHIPKGDDEMKKEVIVFNFCGGQSSDDSSWWLR
ncbi:hypothetical protein Leryth_020166 [Lithospermum erythrorhizon]|nr:hypothetical protein Leryth_020166 [Lithospermum erythrorhizon]